MVMGSYMGLSMAWSFDQKQSHMIAEGVTLT